MTTKWIEQISNHKKSTIDLKIQGQIQPQLNIMTIDLKI